MQIPKMKYKVGEKVKINLASLTYEAEIEDLCGQCSDNGDAHINIDENLVHQLESFMPEFEIIGADFIRHKKAPIYFLKGLDEPFYEHEIY